MDNVYEIEKIFAGVENRLILDIIRRIKKAGEITSTADYQILRLTALGYSSNDIEEVVQKALNGSYPLLWEYYDDVLEKSYVRDKKIYEQLNDKAIPYSSNDELKQVLESTKRQTATQILSLTNSLGVVTNISGQMTFLPLTDYYNRTMDKAVNDIVSGAFDYNSVLRRTVKDLTNSGIRVVDYANSYTSKIDVAVRRAVMTGSSQMAGKISDINGEKLGSDSFEVDWHQGARPSHREWQGKVWTKEELVSVCGLGTVTGLKGANCYHDYYPFIPGVSERKYTDEWLAEQNRLEDKPKSYKGKDYTAYEAKQKQRQMETSMRAQRQKIRALEQGGVDKDTLTIEKARYQGQLQEYKGFSGNMNLKEQRDRIYVDGLGRIASNEKITFTKNPALKTKKGSKQERNYKGKELDKMSKAQLRAIAEEKATRYYKSGASGISFGGTSPEKVAKDLSKAGSKTSLKKDILAIQKKSKATNSVATSYKKGYNNKNTELTTHVVERMKSRGISQQGIYDTLSTPLHSADVKYDTKGRPSQKYIGKEVTVVINPEDGKLITAWKTGTKTKKKYERGK